MRKFLLAICIPLAVMFGGCSENTDQNKISTNSNAPILKIRAFSDGRLTVDGSASSIEKLRESLRTLAAQGGTVWYYREAANQNPPPLAMEVLSEVVTARLPIRLSSKPDYSDSIGP
jgi:hypothetical protein